MNSSVDPSPAPGPTQSPPRSALPVKAAVIGTGGISREHLAFLSGRAPAVGSVTGRIHLVGVCDLSNASASYAATQYSASDHYTDVATMLASAKPDVVHVLTPPETHLALGTQCLEAGIHVICEKPITDNASDLRMFLKTAAANDRHLMESHNYRFNSGIQQIKRMVDEGQLGAVREVEIRIALPVTDSEGRFGDKNLPSPIHQMPAGVIHDFTTHFGYLLLNFATDVDFRRISAAWSNHEGRSDFRFDDLDATLIGDGPEGAVHGRLRFTANTGPDAFTITVRGSHGWAETDLFQPYVKAVIPRPGGSQLSPIVNHLANGGGLIRDGVRNLGRKILQHSPYEGLHLMLDETYSALTTGRDLPVTPAQMLATSELVDRLLSEEVRL